MRELRDEEQRVSERAEFRVYLYLGLGVLKFFFFLILDMYTGRVRPGFV